jgi:hypothetical protein
MKYILTIISLFFTTHTNIEMSIPKIEVSKKEVAIANQIVKNNPNVDKAFAGKLAKLIHKYALIFKADPHRAVAIASQESGFRNVINKNTNKSTYCKRISF